MTEIHVRACVPTKEKKAAVDKKTVHRSFLFSATQISTLDNANMSTNSLLALPTELRLHIYAHVFSVQSNPAAKKVVGTQVVPRASMMEMSRAALR